MKDNNSIAVFILLSLWGCRKEDEKPKANENHYITFTVDGQHYRSIERLTRFRNFGSVSVTGATETYLCILSPGYPKNDYVLTSGDMTHYAGIILGTKEYYTYYKGHGHIKVDSAYGQVFSGTFNFVAYDQSKTDSIVVSDGIFNLDILSN